MMNSPVYVTFDTLAVVLAGPRLVRANRCMRTLELYTFRFRDPLTGKWVRARHKLQVRLVGGGLRILAARAEKR